MESISYLLVSLLSIISSFFLIHQFTKKKTLPPGPTPFPIIGNLIAIGNRPHESLTKLAKTYGPLMTVHMGFNTTIVASSTEMAKEILQKNDLACLGRPIPDAVTAGISGATIVPWISGDQPKWKTFRKLYKTQVFTTQRLDALQGLRHKMTDEMVHHVTKASELGEEIKIGRLVFNTSLNLLSNTIFSGVLTMDDKNSDESVAQLQVLIAKIMELAGKPNLSDFFPFLQPFDLQGIKRAIKVSYDCLAKLVDGVIKQRLIHRASNGLARHGDFLDALLDHSEQYGSEELDRNDVIRLVVDLFVGGTDTTTTTMEWAMTELLKNPSIMAKAKQELVQIIGPNNKIRENDIPKLGYLQCILKETMRLHPTAPLLIPHKTLTEVKIGGFSIPRNTQIFVNSWALALDPEFWDKPSEFIPERFAGLSEMDFQGTNFNFIPFGSGRRICPGISLGMRMLSLMLASLIHHFDWKLAGGLIPETIDMTDNFGVTLQKAIPLVAIPILVG